MKNKTFDGTCFIGTVGSETEYSAARDSVDALRTRTGDSVNFGRGTKGYEVRQQHVNRFLASSHNWLLLLDIDQTFPVDTLERLRSHNLPYVSGLYMRRSYAPVMPVWFEPFRSWPFIPWSAPIEKGKLYQIGASGWGCMLVHRAVFEAVAPLLKGEPFILEDDMDIWPYDLRSILGAVRGLRSLVTERPANSTLYPALEAHIKTLEAEIRPLKAMKDDIVGSDIRFPFYALKAGFQLYGDSGVRCGHVVNYPLSPDDYDGQMSSIEAVKTVKDSVRKLNEAGRKVQRAALEAVR